MTRCAPRNWSRLRLARGLGVLALVYALTCILSGSWFAGIPAVALAIAFDAACVAILKKIDILEVVATIRERGHSAFGVALVGDTTTLAITLDAPAAPLWPVFLTPVLPVGVSVADDRGAILRASAWNPDASPVLFTVKALHAGSHAIPGILLRQSSPLGLFVRTRAIAAPMTLQVLPDFVTTQDPALSHLFRRAFRAELSSPRRIRGGGSDFQELREYRYSDAIHRIDWKASARRTALIVREYDEPREIPLRILLDASLDMTHDSNERSRFHAAATLVTRLACAAVVKGMRLRVTAYDEAVVLDSSLAQGNSGCLRIASQVADLSRDSVVRRARAIFARPERHPLLMASLERTRQFWRPGEEVTANMELESQLAADAAPALLRDAVLPCPECDLHVFPDEARCPGCDLALGSDGFAPRAATLASLLGRDRGMLFVISSLQGGECCDGIADLLAQAAAGGRVVHVVAPGIRSAAPTNASSHSSLGQAPELPEVLADLHRVEREVRLRQFIARLRDAGVHWHAIDDESDLEELVSQSFMGAM